MINIPRAPEDELGVMKKQMGYVSRKIQMLRKSWKEALDTETL